MMRLWGRAQAAVAIVVLQQPSMIINTIVDWFCGAAGGGGGGGDCIPFWIKNAAHISNIP